MHSSSYVVLKNLLEQDTALLTSADNFLSEKSRAALKNAPSINTVIKPNQFELTNLLEEVHYSWLLPIFQKLKTEDLPFYLATFKTKLTLKLKKNLKNDIPLPSLSPLASDYLRSNLLANLLENYKALLPKECLPNSSLTPLLHLNKKELIMLINSLSLFDLAKEYFKIIDKETIKKLDGFLSDSEKLFLKGKRHYQDALILKPLNLDKFTGNALVLKALLHKRGLMRLSKALSLHYFDFIWHLAHTLDIGRGQVLLDLTRQKENQKISDVCQKNILEILPFIKREA